MDMLLYLSELNLISLWNVFGLPLSPLRQDALCSEFSSMRVIAVTEGRSLMAHRVICCGCAKVVGIGAKRTSRTVYENTP
jgi:hypothetical protein